MSRRRSKSCIDQFDGTNLMLSRFVSSRLPDLFRSAPSGTLGI